MITDPSVEGVCEDASDAGGTVTDAGARGTALRRAISNLSITRSSIEVAQRSA
jgi:hypothetical protein